jgi:hypothetical protein
MKITRIILLLLSFLIGTSASCAKKYKFALDHDLMVVQTEASAKGKHIKVWAYGKNADAAIDQALIDAVAAALFTGIKPSVESQGMGIGMLPPLVGQSKYSENESFFKKFFADGEFLKYIERRWGGYPVGDDNIKTPKGRRVGISAILYYDELRKMLEANGINKALNDYFKY